MGEFLRASLGLQRTFAASSSLVPHDDIAHVACYLTDYEQLHRPIGEADSSVPLSDRFDDEVASPMDVTAADLGVGDAKRARQDISVAGKGMFVLVQCGIRRDLVG